MIYRRDKKQMRPPVSLPALALLALVGLFLLLPSFAARGSGALAAAARALFGEGSAVAHGIESYRAFLSGKEALIRENEALRARVETEASAALEFASLKDENARLLALLGRDDSRSLIFAKVILRPNRSLYDTLLIDIGEDHGVAAGARVYAGSGVLVGAVENVYAKTALVSLFSTPGREWDARLGNADVKLVGRGGGSFEAALPRTFPVREGEAVTVPALSRTVIGYVSGVISDARDPFERVLIQSPVSVYEIDEVQVERP